ncbi:hypothetical protein [Acidovorax sp. sic0104]|uniref:hypothetical protein n=1 Tax=Acidovorax sp. sic0104 TaxID=2854784 RepID=UPI001C4793FA|nr:hypothetical protein [Acidovorax sp. sic0104]MBV7542063.1 hypothetical protein [Acidovorax sp. sic0104]
MLDDLPEVPAPAVSEGVARLREACANPVVLVPMESQDLKPAHQRRLRFFFTQGRPIHVTELSVIDLDLIVAGFAYCETLDGRHNTLSAYSRLAITDLGLKALKDQLDRRRDANDVHHTLAGRLARWLREERQCMTWENVTFLAEWGLHAEARLGVVSCAVSPRADSSDLTAWEVKVSVADFRADLANPVKVEASRAIAQSAYYCTPKGLIGPSMLPPGFGLVCESAPGRFEIVKRAKRKRGFVPSPDTLMSLVVRRAVLPKAER